MKICILFTRVAPRTSSEIPMHSGIELEFRDVGFWGDGKNGVSGEKPIGAEYRTKNKLSFLGKEISIPEGHCDI